MSQSQTVGGFSEIETVTIEITRAVADEEDCSPLELPPLYDAVDADAMETVLQGADSCELTFRYHGYEVEVDGAGTVDVQ